MNRQDGHWLFGYGSLIWRPDFPYIERVPAWIHGYERRLWQGSPDHRGTPEHPGRVATLVPKPDARCVGVAYQVAAADAKRVLEELRLREIAGYALEETTAYRLDDDGPLAPVQLWIAQPGNASWLGPASPASIAEQIRARRGASGTNLEYVERLASALDAMGVQDRDLMDILDHI